jgi:leucyl aminopeptidase
LRRALGAKGKCRPVLDLVGPSALAQRRLLLVALDHEKPTADELSAEESGAALIAALHEAGESEATLHVEPVLGSRLETSALAARLALGAGLAAYRFDRYRTRPRAEDRPKVRALTLALPDGAAAKAAAGAWQRLAPLLAGVALARDLENEPGNVIYPASFVERAAAALAPLGVEIQVFEEKALRRMGMNALLGVGEGSAKRPRLLVMRWAGAEDAPLAFVGKGVTFDTGGISIKKAAGMEDMKYDMSGAAAVVGALRALAGAKAKVAAIGVCALVENMPSGRAQLPSHVIKTYDGKTVELVDTDAEGRMILIDALAYTAQQLKPRAIVDLATLTYSIVAGLGHVYAGLYSNDDALAEAVAAAGRRSGEKFWRMPLDADYLANLKSHIADLRQCGPDDEFADAAHAAVFLEQFVQGCRWAHLDIAGKMTSHQGGGGSKWALGFGVRSLVELATAAR